MQSFRGGRIVRYTHLRYTGHVVRRMFERRIEREAVLETLAKGRTIAEYPDDKPFPSRLILAFINGQPLHVVAAYDESSQTCIVISVYEPDPDLWEDKFTSRKPR